MNSNTTIGLVVKRESVETRVTFDGNGGVQNLLVVSSSLTGVSEEREEGEVIWTNQTQISHRQMVMGSHSRGVRLNSFGNKVPEMKTEEAEVGLLLHFADSAGKENEAVDGVFGLGIKERSMDVEGVQGSLMQGVNRPMLQVNNNSNNNTLIIRKRSASREAENLNLGKRICGEQVNVRQNSVIESHPLMPGSVSLESIVMNRHLSDQRLAYINAMPLVELYEFLAENLDKGNYSVVELFANQCLRFRDKLTNESRARFHFFISSAFRMQKRYDECIKAARDGLMINYNYDPKANLCYNIAFSLNHLGKFSEGERAARKGLGVQDCTGGVKALLCYQLSVACYGQKEYQKAKEAADKGLMIVGTSDALVASLKRFSALAYNELSIGFLAEDVMFYVNYSWECIQQGNHNEAEESALNGLSLRGLSDIVKARLYRNLASAYLGQKKYIESQESALKGLSLSGCYGFVKVALCNVLSFVYIEQGKYEEARVVAGQGLNIVGCSGEQKVALYTNLGTVYRGLGNEGRALVCFFDALECSKNINNRKFVEEVLNQLGNFGTPSEISKKLAAMIEAAEVGILKEGLMRARIILHNSIRKS